jgi:RNA polymerase primary sigma factor
MSKQSDTGGGQERSARLSDEQRCLVEANLGLVWALWQKYRSAPLSADIFQAGCLGLIRAAQYFEAERGFQFSTFAVPLIRRSIRQAWADQFQGGLGTGQNNKDLLPRVIRAYWLIQDEGRRDPTAEQIAEHMGKDVGMIRRALRLYERQVVSLEQPVYEDLTLAETLEDDPEHAPEAVVIQEIRTRRVRQLLSLLSPRERLVIGLRYGFVDNREWEYDQIAERMQVERQTVSRIAERALFKLRRPAALQGLHELLD